jgi:hypothetical protein
MVAQRHRNVVSVSGKRLARCRIEAELKPIKLERREIGDALPATPEQVVSQFANLVPEYI